MFYYGIKNTNSELHVFIKVCINYKSYFEKKLEKIYKKVKYTFIVYISN